MNIVQPDIIFSSHYHFGMNTLSVRDTGKALKDSAMFTRANEAPLKINLEDDR